MAMYETIFILDSLLTPEEIDKMIDRVKQYLQQDMSEQVDYSQSIAQLEELFSGA